MSESRPSKTDLRRGRILQSRRPRTVMEPVTPAELHALQTDGDDAPAPLGLHDSTEQPGAD